VPDGSGVAAPVALRSALSVLTAEPAASDAIGTALVTGAVADVVALAALSAPTLAARALSASASTHRSDPRMAP
jgi:hypothetical protein